METVEFKKIVYDRINGRPVIGNLYKTVNPTDDKDYSGVYVLSSEAAERERALWEALDGLYQHTKNDMQIAGLNIAAAAALDAAKEG